MKIVFLHASSVDFSRIRSIEMRTGFEWSALDLLRCFSSPRVKYSSRVTTKSGLSNMQVGVRSDLCFTGGSPVSEDPGLDYLISLWGTFRDEKGHAP